MRNFVTNLETLDYDSIGGTEIDGVGVVVGKRFALRRRLSVRLGKVVPVIVIVVTTGAAVMVAVLGRDLAKNCTGVVMRSASASRNIVTVTKGC
ncbi:MAG: hypothetical protein EXR99_11425 [Gemmataceae bacterium]|nr:hypothetical protein [Gemmataceae bacterium]